MIFTFYTHFRVTSLKHLCQIRFCSWKLHLTTKSLAICMIFFLKIHFQQWLGKLVGIYRIKFGWFFEIGLFFFLVGIYEIFHAEIWIQPPSAFVLIGTNCCLSIFRNVIHNERTNKCMSFSHSCALVFGQLTFIFCTNNMDNSFNYTSYRSFGLFDDVKCHLIIIYAYNFENATYSNGDLLDKNEF